MNQKILVLLVLCSFFMIDTYGAALKGGKRKPRSFCGYQQIKNSGLLDFSLLNHRYDHKDLTYTITDYTNQLSRSNIDKIIAQAFDAWADVTDLTFKRINRAPADVVIRFVAGDHGDGHPFDGRGNVLAHAYYGYAHFDDSEYWTNRLESGLTNLYSVAVHEIGHVLGLDHSNIKRTIMYPSYDPSNVVMDLHNDDINGIQRLYGKKTTRDNDEEDEYNDDGDHDEEDEDDEHNEDDNDDEEDEKDEDSNTIGGGTRGGDVNDCWTTGCQPNSWAVVGCGQYERTERSKIGCSGGYMYECCKETTTRTNPGSSSECWTTGCQLNSWAVVGCQQYGMSQVEKFQCSGGHMYKCCK